jgi:omega-6 fatty acid desaturase (delta-12 desaturase)
MFDWALYLAAVATAILAENLVLRVLAVVVGGVAISMLFILGHDAAHKSLFSKRAWNGVVCRILFLPCLHNYTLWVIQHNRLHHQVTNVKGLNSYSPLSFTEFGGMALWRRIRERMYRSVLGFGVYYFVERWWRDKFFPRRTVARGRRIAAWLDFALLLAWVSAFLIVLALLNVTAGRVASAFLWGFVLPFLVWNQLMGLTAFLQHTHPAVPWFRTREEARGSRTQAEVTVVVQFPAWYDMLSHNIMQHQAHHVNPRIPWYRLKSAQRRLSPLLGSSAIVEKMGIRYLLWLTRTCRLYDYENRRWLDYAGRQSSTTDHPGAHLELGGAGSK